MHRVFRQTELVLLLVVSVLLCIGVMAGCAAPQPIGFYGVSQITVPYVDRSSGPLLMDLALPIDGRLNRPAILWIHGGAFVSGDRGCMGPLMQFTASMGYVSASIDYRLVTSGASATDIYDDVRAAYNFMSLHAGELGLDPTCVSVGGDSAGGQLALLVGIKEPGVRSIVSIYSSTALAQLYDDTKGTPVGAGLLLLMRSRPDENPVLWMAFSPIEGVAETSPPVLILHGTADHVIPFSQAELLLQRWTAMGRTCLFVPVGGAEHGWVVNPLSDNSLRTAPIILRFLDVYGCAGERR